jgi:hypothetical protein
MHATYTHTRGSARSGRGELTSRVHCSSCRSCNSQTKTSTKQTPWSESANELNRPSDRRLSAKLVPTFADRGCRVVSVTDP